MSRSRIKSAERKPLNLSLTPEAISMLDQLAVALRRPSKSNVVETLTYDRAKQLKLVPN
jgi:hypothetical protein